MEHPRFVRRIHRFLNPVREGALREAEERVARFREAGVTEPHFEAEIERLRHPNTVTFAQVYAMLVGAVVLIVAIVAMIVLR